MHCAFCEAAGDLSRFGTVIHEDDHCAVALHPDSSPAGHAMVIWKRHVENVADLEPGELRHFSRVHAASERVLLRETGRDRAILLKLGIQVPTCTFTSIPCPPPQHAPTSWPRSMAR